LYAEGGGRHKYFFFNQEIFSEFFYWFFVLIFREKFLQISHGHLEHFAHFGQALVQFSLSFMHESQRRGDVEPFFEPKILRLELWHFE
jgi:hypothetical protein